MLVLARKVGEEVVVKTPDGALLRLVVLSSIKGRIRLGFVGKKEDFRVDRREVFDRKQAAMSTEAAEES
jgi:sRNA-binding carbon storage regulator CsrA